MGGVRGGLCRAATSRRGIEVSHASVTWVGNLALILGSKSNLSLTPEGTKFRSEGQMISSITSV